MDCTNGGGGDDSKRVEAMRLVGCKESAHVQLERTEAVMERLTCVVPVIQRNECSYSIAVSPNLTGIPNISNRSVR